MKTDRILIIGLLLFTFIKGVNAQNNAFIEKEVSFLNGSLELKGTLLLPEQSTTAPAIVFLHGSGPHQRDGFRPYAEKFAKLGIASLFFDKRGSGKSSGSWITSSLEDLANDAIAAVQFLKYQEQIDPNRIGFWGISQAGWVATKAVAKSSDDISFMILITGGGASPRQSELHSYQHEFDKAGLSANDQSKANKILNQYFDYLATGKTRSQLVNSLDEIRKGNLKELADQINRILPSKENRHNWSWVGNYDPVRDIAKVRCPVLIMLGEKDTDHPTALAKEKWQKGLKKVRNKDATIIVFQGAGHGIRPGNTANGNETKPFVDGYMEVQIGWLWLNVLKEELAYRD